MTSAGSKRYLGNFSAAPPWYSFLCTCAHCNVSWTGCQDAADCPLCGRGSVDYDELLNAVVDKFEGPQP